MKIFVVIPTKVYALDVILPLLVQLKSLRPGIDVTFIFFRRQSLEKLNRDQSIKDLVDSLGKSVCAYAPSFLESHSQALAKMFKFFSLIPLWFRMLLAKKSVLLQPRFIEAFTEKFMTWINGLSGKTFCYFLINTPLTENLVQYYDEQGQARPGVAQAPKVRNVADGILAYHPDNIPFLEKQGYLKRHIIGYPLLYGAYQDHLRCTFRDYVKKEVGENLDPSNTVTIFFNKYFRGMFARDDAWAERCITDVLKTVRQAFPDAYILVRTHPMLPRVKVETMIKHLNLPRVRQSHLNVFILAHASRFAVSIANSSCELQSLACGTPVVSYGEHNDFFYKLYPQGSPYLEFGVQVAKNPLELKAFIERVDQQASHWVQMLYQKMGNYENLRVFNDN